MSTSSTVLPTLVGFALSMILLYVLSRRVSIEIQTVIYLLTRSLDMSTIGLFLILLPGIFIHESAHWGMARLLGLRTGKFRVWPKRQGKIIGMGQVTVEQGGVWLDSLVGMAPLLVGSIIVALIGRQIFGAHQLMAQAYEGDFRDATSFFANAMRAADSALWAYLAFCGRQRHDAQRQRPGAVAARAALRGASGHHISRPRPAAHPVHSRA
jgi:hypothetical protein